MQIRIAVVQFGVQPLASPQTRAEAEQRREEIAQRVEHYMQAASGQADIIVFPENFLTVQLQDQALADYEGHYLRYFQQLATTYHIDLVAGSCIEGDTQGQYNTTYYIDKTGSIRGKYRKIHLWHPEKDYLAAGNAISVFDTAYGRVGLCICWDLIFPEVFRAMLQQGVEIVFCPSYWCFEDAGNGLQYDANAEIKLVDALCTARAFENEIIVVYANAAGQEQVRDTLQRLIGHSQITVPFIGPLQILPHANEDMFIQTVDTALLKVAEASYTIRKDFGIQDTNSVRIGHVIATHQASYADPISMHAHDELTLNSKKDNWHGHIWIWCTNQTGKSGWVPEEYIEEHGTKGFARYDYDAIELSVASGEILQVEKEQSGWLWCSNQQERRGWVPARNVDLHSSR